LADTIDTTGLTIDSNEQFISGASQFGYATLIPLNQSGIGFLTPRAAFLSGSACSFQCSYFDVNGNALEPIALTYEVVDLLSGETIVEATALPLESTSNVIITAAQNEMISVSRSCETHALIVSVTDGTENVSMRRALFEIVRSP
jgi:hypothetical protein